MSTLSAYRALATRSLVWVKTSTTSSESIESNFSSVTNNKLCLPGTVFNPSKTGPGLISPVLFWRELLILFLLPLIASESLFNLFVIAFRAANSTTQSRFNAQGMISIIKCWFANIFLGWTEWKENQDCPRWVVGGEEQKYNYHSKLSKPGKGVHPQLICFIYYLLNHKGENL